MRIVLFYRSLNQGGVQKMMANLSNGFTNRGHEVSLILIRKQGKYLESITERVKIYEIGSSNPLSIIRFLERFLKKASYDVLFTATPSLNIAAIIAKIVSKSTTQLVLSERIDPISELLNTKLGAYKLSYILIPFLYAQADSIIAVSNGVKESLVKFAPFTRKKIRVINNPAFDNHNYQESLVSHKWFLNDEVPTIISAGRLAKQKNFQLLLNAIANLTEERDVRLIILGEGELEESLKKQAFELNINDIVDFVGFQPNPIDWIRESDVFVLSSLWEGFGNVLIDALVAKTTIVSTNCKSGPSEILNDGEFGYLIDDFNPETLSSMISYAIDNPLSQEKLFDRAFDFSTDKILDKYETLFTSLLRNLK